MPREHGAYAQLAFPLLSGLILGAPPWPGYALAAAAVLLFLAYEPLVVLLGVRGARLQQEESAAARRQLPVLAAAGLILAGAALLGLPAPARLLVLVPLAAAGLLLPLVPTRRVKTLAGETLVAAALSSMHLPIAAAGGAQGVRLWGPPLVWFAGFFLATLAVHAIKARQKQRDRWLPVTAVGAAAAGLALAVALFLAVPSLRLLAVALALPIAAVLAVNLKRVHPRQLKRVGWTLVAADSATLVLLAFL